MCQPHSSWSPLSSNLLWLLHVPWSGCPCLAQNAPAAPLILHQPLCLFLKPSSGSPSGALCWSLKAGRPPLCSPWCWAWAEVGLRCWVGGVWLLMPPRVVVSEPTWTAGPSGPRERGEALRSGKGRLQSPSLTTASCVTMASSWPL